MKVLLIIFVRKGSLSGRHQRDLSRGKQETGYRLKTSDRSLIARVLLNSIIPLLPRLAERAERSLNAVLCVSVPGTCDDGAMPKALLIGHDVNVLPGPVYAEGVLS